MQRLALILCLMVMVCSCNKAQRLQLGQTVSASFDASSPNDGKYYYHLYEIDLPSNQITVELSSHNGATIGMSAWYGNVEAVMLSTSAEGTKKSMAMPQGGSTEIHTWVVASKVSGAAAYSFVINSN